MANMPGQNEQPKPASGGGEKQPEGHHSPGTQQPQNFAQGPGGAQQEYKPIEPKRRDDEASGRQEPSANPKRAPEHTPGYEAQQQKKEGKDRDKNRQEGDYKDEQDRNTRVMQGGRSQADVGDEELDAKDDEKTLHGQKGQRARTAHRKTDTKRSKVNVKVKKARKHK